MKAILICAALALSGVSTAALAQEGEIVVTSQRRASAFEDLSIPHVYLKRRADFAIVSLEVRSDTRDFTARRDEIREALRDLQSRARAEITLALVDDEAGIVRPFSMGAAEELIRADRRPDTSLLTIRLRTPVSANDTLEQIHRRIEAFVTSAPKPGRVEMETGDTELTLVNPEQYRARHHCRRAGDSRGAWRGLRRAAWRPGKPSRVASHRRFRIDVVLPVRAERCPLASVGIPRRSFSRCGEGG